MATNKRNQKQSVFRIFIAYRQGADEGDACARFLFQSLHGRSIDAEDGSERKIEVYFDHDAPAISDFRLKWKADLRTSKAMLLICSPGAAQARSGRDWLHDEVNWWADHRRTGPIVIETTDVGEDAIPHRIRDKWPYAQRVRWANDLSIPEQQSLIDRILKGVLLSETGINYEDLRQLRWRNRTLGALLVTVSLLAVGILITLRGQTAARRDAERHLQNLYGPTLQLAQRAFYEGRAGEAKELLRKCPPKFRNWEWNYLRLLVDESIATAPVSDRILDIAFSADGNSLVMGDINGVVHLRDGTDAHSIQELKGHVPRVTEKVTNNSDGSSQIIKSTDSASVLAVAMLNDGRIVSGGNDGTVRLWNPATGHHEVLGRHKGEVHALAVSHDSRLIASGDYAGRIYLWDVKERNLKSIISPNLQIDHLAFAPDDNTLLSLGFTFYALNNYDRYASIWRVLNSRSAIKVGNLKVGARMLSQARYLSADRIIGRYADGTVGVWSATTLQRFVEWPDSKESAGFGSIAISPDRSLAAINSSKRQIALYNLKSGRRVRNLSGQEEEISVLAFSPRRNLLASADEQTIKIWDLAKPIPRRDFLCSTDAIACSIDGNKILTITPADNFDPNVVQKLVLWNLQNGSSSTLDGEGALNIELMPDGHSFVSTWKDKTLRLQDLSSGEVKWKVTTKDEAQFLAVSRDGGLIATSGQSWIDNTIEIWDARNGTLVRALPGKDAIAFSPDGKYLVGGDLHTNQRKDEPPVSKKLFAIWNIASGKQISGAPDRNYEDRLTTVAFSPDGTMLATNDGPWMRIWRVKDGTELRSLLAKRGDYNSTNLAFSPDGKRIATTTFGLLSIWDVDTGNLLLDIRTRDEVGHLLRWNAKSNRIIVGSKSQNGRFEVFDANLAGRDPWSDSGK
jgi:WD40 repeat protein